MTHAAVRIVICQPDLDTCLTGLILGVLRDMPVEWAKAGASPEDLANPAVWCIEAGGSGQIRLNNFDHHDPDQDLPPACRQAYEAKGLQNPALSRLVDYVCRVDMALPIHPVIPFPSLSTVFSGMRMVEKGELQRFFTGMDLLGRVLSEGMDPFLAMPEVPAWGAYVDVKRRNLEGLTADFKKAGYGVSQGGRRIGWMTSTYIGGSRMLYDAGCDLAVLLHPAFGDPPAPKFTISAARTDVSLKALLTVLQSREPGWGGRDGIIGSPRGGSRLSLETVLTEAMKWL